MHEHGRLGVRHRNTEREPGRGRRDRRPHGRGVGVGLVGPVAVTGCALDHRIGGAEAPRNGDAPRTQFARHQAVAGVEQGVRDVLAAEVGTVAGAHQHTIEHEPARHLTVEATEELGLTLDSSFHEGPSKAVLNADAN